MAQDDLIIYPPPGNAVDGWLQLLFDRRVTSMDRDPNGISQLSGGAVAEANGNSIRFSINGTGYTDPMDGCAIFWRARDIWGREVDRMNVAAAALALLTAAAPTVNGKHAVVAGYLNGNAPATDTIVWGGQAYTDATNVVSTLGTDATAVDAGTNTANTRHALVQFSGNQSNGGKVPVVRHIRSATYDSSRNGEGVNPPADSQIAAAQFDASDPHIFLAVYPRAAMSGTETVDLQLFHKHLPDDGTAQIPELLP